MAIHRLSLVKLFARHALQWLRQSLTVLHRLWLEITGAVFLGLAIFAAPSAVREWRVYQQGGSVGRLASTILFMAMMVGFGVYSFLRARRIR